MPLALTIFRMIFVSLCIILSAAYAATNALMDTLALSLLAGVATGLSFATLIIAFETILRRIGLRIFNIVGLGLIVGFLMGEAILLIANAVFDAASIEMSAQAAAMLRVLVFLIACYLGMAATARSSDEFYLSIPFIKLKPGTQKKKDLLVDSSALLDPRLIDLASSGLVDQQLMIPRCFVKEQEDLVDHSDEAVRTKARRILDNLKKLEKMPSLEMRFTEAAVPEVKEASAKILRIARMTDANILTADATRLQQPLGEEPRFINLNALSHALKPLSQNGENLTIKIQRYGKEPRQGVGYLEDGTMVVVNGGAEYIGETIRTQVLSVKHTASGRMIFCNALDSSEDTESVSVSETMASNYFAH